MAPVSLLDELKQLYATRDLVPKDPKSDPARRWLSSVIALLNQVDPRRAEAFENGASILHPRLSFRRLDDTWDEMTFMLQTVITELELRATGIEEKVYGPRESYDLYQDLRDAIGGATSSVFVIDPYADEEIFDLYFARCQTGVEIRFLTKRLTPALQAVIAKFRQRPNIRLEVRISDEIHDRVIFRDDACWVVGTSIGRHATTKKPTYLVAVHDVRGMRVPDEEIWARATPAASSS